MLDNTFNKKESPLVGMMGGGPGGPLGISGGAKGPSYPDDTFWISIADRGGWNNEYPENIDWDNDGNIYVNSIRYDAGGQGQKGGSFTSFAVDGTRNWQKVLYRSSIAMEDRVIIAELDGDHVYTGGQSNAGVYIAKINKSDGTVDWVRNIGSNSNPNNMPIAGAIGSDGNPIFLVRWSEGNGEQMYISLDESNGSTNWSTLVTRNAGSNETINMDNSHPKIDSSGNIYSVVYASTSYPNYYGGLVKHNSSGVLQSVSDYQSSYPNEDQFSDVTIDSSGNKYIAARYKTSGTSVKVCVIKVNSSDAIQWQTAISSSSNALYPEQIEITPNGSELVIKIDDRQSDKVNAFVKLNTSDGTEVWKRQLGYYNRDLSGSSGRMRLNRNGNIINLTTFYHSGLDKTYVITAQLPGDGTGTGTYTPSGYSSFSWAASTNITVTASQTIFAKQGSSIFTSGSVTPSNAAYSSTTLANNIQVFTNVAVS